jgi:vacuolar-type H+-ATPase subunit H
MQQYDRSEAPVDPLDRIDEIISLVEQARSVPMSRTNFMFDRNEMVAILDELRAELPGDLRRAAALLEERDKIIDAGKREADRIIGEGETEHARLVSVNEITVSAEHEGARIVAEARSEAQRLREEVDDYVDTALANFEQFLTRSLSSIERGRDKMHALREIGTFQGEENERPLPF